MDRAPNWPAKESQSMQPFQNKKSDDLPKTENRLVQAKKKGCKKAKCSKWKGGACKCGRD